MVANNDKRWLIVVLSTVAGFLVLGRARVLWASDALGVLGPYWLWIGLIFFAVAVAWLWSAEEEAK